MVLAAGEGVRVRRRLLLALVTVGASVAVLVGVAAPAQAETKSANWVEQVTASGYCYAEVDLRTNSANNVVAHGHFENFLAGWTCTAWLERSTDGGGHWSTVSGYHTLDSIPGLVEDGTGDYYDGVGYLARACFHLDFTGAANHCTYGA